MPGAEARQFRKLYLLEQDEDASAALAVGASADPVLQALADSVPDQELPSVRFLLASCWVDLFLSLTSLKLLCDWKVKKRQSVIR